MTPKAYMITGLTEKGLQTECAYLDLSDKALLLSMLCLGVPKFGNSCSLNRRITTITREDVQKAKFTLSRLYQSKSLPDVKSILFPIETEYGLEHHQETKPLKYLEYASRVSRFLYDGYMSCQSAEFDIVII